MLDKFMTDKLLVIYFKTLFDKMKWIFSIMVLSNENFKIQVIASLPD